MLSVLVGIIALLSCNQDRNQTVSDPQAFYDEIQVNLIANPGANILPVYNDTLAFTGLPTFIGKDNIEGRENIYLVFGKKFTTRKKLSIRPIAAMNFKVDKQARKIYLAIPSDANKQNWNLAEDEDFNIDYSYLKLWLQDWLTYSYKDKKYEFVDWQMNQSYEK